MDNSRSFLLIIIIRKEIVMNTFTTTTIAKKNIRHNRFLFLVLFLCYFSSIVFPHLSEFRMHVGNGSAYWAETVELYSLKSYLEHTGSSSNEARGEVIDGAVINFIADITDGQGNTPNPSMEPVAPGSYLLKIGNKYCFLTIPQFNPSYNADFVLKFAGGVFTRLDNPNTGRRITLSQTFDWIGNTVTLKNSFNVAGQMLLDGVSTSIPAAGSTFNFESSSFPHTFTAVDQQPTGINYMQRFSNWTGDLVTTPNSNRVLNINAGNGTYTANFRNEYNITFQNSFSSATGGIIKVNGTEHNAPYQTTALQDDTINATAETNIINNIIYSFDHWSDGSTEGYNHHFTPTNHQTYTAYYVGKPSIANRGLNFYWAEPNDPITVSWNEHPNTNVTQYQILRRVKYDKQATSSPTLIATVNRGTTTFVDYDYAGTNLGFTKWILWYDVRPYYSIEQTYSDTSWVLVFSNGPLAKKGTSLAANTTGNVVENKIENYPNPFNPSTVIAYQIVKQGHVSLKVYDGLGKEIAELVNKEQTKGKYSVVFKADNLASGIYFYKIIANGFTETKKMILTK